MGGGRGCSAPRFTSPGAEEDIQAPGHVDGGQENHLQTADHLSGRLRLWYYSPRVRESEPPRLVAGSAARASALSSPPPPAVHLIRL